MSATFTSSLTWICPAGVTSVQIECWGSGGAGGNAHTAGGSGGGGGAYAKKNAYTVTPGNSYTIIVGAAGGNIFSEFVDGATTVCKADGGTNGADDAGTAGAGGLTANSVGDITYAGGGGAVGGGTNGGGGGSSAGPASAGNASSSSFGATGPTGSGTGGNGATTSVSAQGGSNPGGGGGGGAVSGSYGTGAFQTNGKIILTYAGADPYFIPPAKVPAIPAALPTSPVARQLLTPAAVVAASTYLPPPARRVAEDRPAIIDLPRPKLTPLMYAAFAAAGRGLYRVFNPAAYRIFRNSSRPPLTTDTPSHTTTTLPCTPADTFADGTWYFSMSFFDGVLDSGFLPLGPHGETYLTLTLSGGVPVPTPPSPPASANLSVGLAGVITVNAYYLAIPDGADAATQWSIAYTTDGSTPASDSPTITPAINPKSAVSRLAYNLPAQANGTVVKVQLQVRRLISGSTYAYSPPGAVMSAVAVTVGPTAPLDLTAWPGALPEYE